MIKMILLSIIFSISLFADATQVVFAKNKEACDRGNLSSCVKLGILYESGVDDGSGFKQKKTKAMRL